MAHDEKKGGDPARLLGLGLVLLTLCVFAQTTSFEFLLFDDDIYVTDVAGLRHGLSLEGVVWAWEHLASGLLWHPLTSLSLLVDFELYGLRPGGYHATNVLLHAATSVLLFLALRAATGAVWRSALVAALFAVHPLHVESVAWISGRKDVLSGLFAMGTLWAYAHYARVGGWRAYGIVTLLFVAGLLSKPIVVTLPMLFLLLDLWPLERVSLGTLWSRNAARLALEKLPWIGLSAAISLVSMRDQQGGGAAWSFDVLGVPARIANALDAYVQYLANTIWPFDLSPYYPHPSLPGTGGEPLTTTAIASAAAVLVLFTAAAWRARAQPYWLVGWLWFVGMLVPVIGLLQVGGQAYADRYTYLPLCGLFVAIVWGAGDWFATRSTTPRRRFVLAAAVSGLLVAACGVIAWNQTHYWRDSETLFRHALDIHPRNMLMRTNLGLALQQQGRPAEALAEYARAIEISPNYPLLHFQSGIAYAAVGDLRAAEERFRHAVALTPDVGLVRAHLADVLVAQGRAAEAIEEYQIALARQPGYGALHVALAQALHVAGRLDEAEAENRAALEIDPQDVTATYQLANVMGAKGRIDAAQATLLRVLELAPDHEGARKRLAGIAEREGKAGL